MPAAQSPASPGGDLAVRSGLALAGILLLAANLRAGITSVGPVLGDIRADLGISGSAASFLISLPVIGFALVSPLAPPLARRLGLEWTLGGSLLVLCGAIVLRSAPVPGAIWVGTALLGATVAIINVLLPALVKREYPRQVGLMTGVYAATQSAIAALAAGLAVPIAGASQLGWRLSLGIWAGLALIGFAVLLPLIRRRTAAPSGAAASGAAPVASAPSAARPGDPTPPADAAGASPAPDPPPPAPLPAAPSMWRSPLAWQVTLFLGLQSTIYYTVITWWPAIEQSQGLSASVAGWHQFAFQACGIAGSLTGAALLHRMRTQSSLAIVAAALPITALTGQLIAPALGLLWVVLLGAAGGLAITTALSLFGLRTRTHQQAASLSGMAQSLGYLLAALGPVLVGALHDATGSWRPGLLLIICCASGMLVAGALAGRHRFVGEHRPIGDRRR